MLKQIVHDRLIYHQHVPFQIHRWAVFRRTNARIKCLRLVYDGMALPDEVIVTLTKTADKKKLGERSS